MNDRPSFGKLASSSAHRAGGNVRKRAFIWPINARWLQTAQFTDLTATDAAFTHLFGLSLEID